MAVGLELLLLLYYYKLKAIQQDLSALCNL